MDGRSVHGFVSQATGMKPSNSGCPTVCKCMQVMAVLHCNGCSSCRCCDEACGVIPAGSCLVLTRESAARALFLTSRESVVPSTGF
jgi:hypothetical protein